MSITRRFQFPLISLLLLVIPAAIGALWIKTVLLGRQPIVWQEFTPDVLARHVRDGEMVLVFASPNYHTESARAAMAFDDKRVRRAFHHGHFVALLLQYDDWSGESYRSLAREFGGTKDPSMVVYSPDNSPARILEVSADRILKELPRRLAPPYGVLFGVSAALVALSIWRLRRKSTDNDERPCRTALV